MKRIDLSTDLVLVLVLLLGAASAPLGCGGGEPEKPAKPARKGTDPAAKAKRKEIEEKLGTLKNAVLNNALAWDGTVADCERYQLEAKEAGLGDLDQKLEGLKKQAREEFETAAEKETVKAIEEAKAYIAQGEMKKARNRLAGLHRNIQKEDRFWSRALAAVGEIEKAERAERYYGRVTKDKVDQFKRYGDWERAQGVLEAFLAIPAFQTSPRVKDVETALAEVKPEAEKVRSARASEQKIRWLPAFNGAEKDLYEWTLADPQALSVGSDKLVTFKNEGDEPNGLSMMYGKDEWEDYIVDAVFKIDKGAMYVNFHGFLEGEEENQSRNWQQGVKLEASDFQEKDRFTKVRFECRGGDLRWTLPGSTSPTSKKLKSPRGPFEIRILKGSQIQLKTIWAKVLKPAGA